MNILLIQLKRIGDLILTTPAIAAVREKFPRANISLIVSASTRELLSGNSRHVDRTFIARGRISDAASWFTVAARKYEYCLDFTRNDRSAFLTLLSGARYRITTDHPKQRVKIRALSYNELVDTPIGLVQTLHVDFYWHCSSRWELPTRRRASPALRLGPPAAAEDEADRVLAQAHVDGDFPYVLVHPGSARAEKFWEADRWAAVIEHAADALEHDCVRDRRARGRLSREHIADRSSRAAILPRLSICRAASICSR